MSGDRVGPGGGAGVPSVPGVVDLVRVGRGGFSVVYRGTQERLGRAVAVKVLLTDLTDPDEIRRFTNECQILGRLGAHPHVVDVYDAHVSPDGRPYIVMKFYGRGTLADRLRVVGPLPPAEVVAIGSKLASALQAAHEIGVVHRDVKPENVLIDNDGEPVLGDFGVAAVADASGGYTSSVAFSRAHVAPEVLDRNEFGPSSDVYSLGSTLYTVATGSNAFAGDTEVRQAMAIMTTEPTPPTGVPAPLAAVILKAMAKDPGQRYASAAEFGAALAACNLAAAPVDDATRRKITAVPVAGAAAAASWSSAPTELRAPGSPAPAAPSGSTVLTSGAGAAAPAPSAKGTSAVVIGAVAATVVLALTVAGLAIVLVTKNGQPAAAATSTAPSASQSVAGASSTAPAASQPATTAPASTRAASIPAGAPAGSLAATLPGTTWVGTMTSDPYLSNGALATDDLRLTVTFSRVDASGIADAVVQWQGSGRPHAYRSKGPVSGTRVDLQGYVWLVASDFNKFSLDHMTLDVQGATMSGTYRGQKGCTTPDGSTTGDCGIVALKQQ